MPLSGQGSSTSRTAGTVFDNGIRPVPVVAIFAPLRGNPRF